MTCEHDWEGRAEVGEMSYCTTMKSLSFTGMAYLTCTICGAKAEARLNADATPKEVDA